MYRFIIAVAVFLFVGVALVVHSIVAHAEPMAPNVQEKPAVQMPPTKPPNPPIMLPPGFTNQRPYGQIFPIRKQLTCNDTKVIQLAAKHQYKETPIMMGQIRNAMGVTTMITMLYVNKQTRAFSIIEHTVNGISCILTSGHELDYIYDYDWLNPSGRPF
jgi:hypothetical protein